MFKKTKKPAQPAHQKDPVVVEAEKAIARGQRIKSLSEDADMWRRFSAECKPGRRVLEAEMPPSYMLSPVEALSYVARARLSLVMNADTAPLWAAFAVQMSEQCERRLKEILGV